MSVERYKYVTLPHNLIVGVVLLPTFHLIIAMPKPLIWRIYLFRLWAMNILRWLKIKGMEKAKRINPQLDEPLPTRTTFYSSHGRKLRIDIYMPPEIKETWHTPFPVHINWHGCGFCLPGMGEDALFCSYIAKRAGCVVIDADYSKAPEYTWPIQNTEADTVIAWVRSSAAANGWDADRISLGGFSSGGNIALVAATVGSQRAGIKAVAVFYPITDGAKPTAEKAAARHDLSKIERFLSTQFLRLCMNICYVPHSANPLSPYISPTYTPTAAFPPSITIVTCSRDLLRDEAQALAERLKEDPRLDVVSYDAEGQGHTWDKTAKIGSKAAEIRDEAYELVAQRLKKAFGDERDTSSIRVDTKL